MKRSQLLLLWVAPVVVADGLLTVVAIRAGWLWQGWTAVAAIATFLAVVVALLIAIWGDWLRTLGRAPLLWLTLDPTTDHFQRFLTDTAETIYSVRISVTNDGEIGAKNVEVVAQELTVKGPDGLFTGDPVFMAIDLTRTHYSVFRRRPSSA